MAGIEGEDRSHRDITPYRDTQQDAEGTLPVAAFFGHLSETPPQEDLAYWPVYVLNPTFKGVWYAAANFAPLPRLDTRLDQCPRPHR